MQRIQGIVLSPIPDGIIPHRVRRKILTGGDLYSSLCSFHHRRSEFFLPRRIHPAYLPLRRDQPPRTIAINITSGETAAVVVESPHTGSDHKVFALPESSHGALQMLHTFALILHLIGPYPKFTDKDSLIRVYC